ncbi:SH2 domain containing protein [Trichuris trichiura]|uniref:SH2 domain containing protein n=1 Tax=Trichuris trichiura TaxID=36087 RepID=A0A077Z0C6_TRITR|nr:SH2 domain containing protein [Trichuris trichiura]
MASTIDIDVARRCFILESMQQFRQCPWYWGALSPEEAECILVDKPVGSFLVRDSSDLRHFFSLSYKGEKRVYHSRIGQDKGQFFFGRTTDPRGCALSLIDLFRVARERTERREFEFLLYPTAGRFDAEHVTFKNPILRKVFVPSLQLLCKRELIRHVAWENLDLLPMSVPLKLFVKSTNVQVMF